MIKKPIAQSRCCRTKLDGGYSRVGCFAVLALLCLRALVSAAPNEDVIFGMDGAGHAGRNESRVAAEAEGIALPYSRILRGTEPPYDNLFRDVRVGGRFQEQIGPVDAFAQGTLKPRLYLPFAVPGVRPEDAELRIGRFYLDLRRLSASLLYSDNVHWAEHGREDGVIGIVQLTSAALFEVSDAVRFAVQGTLIYLPFSGEVGVAGFGIADPAIEFGNAPLFQAQLTLEQNIGDWTVELIDEVRILARRFGADLGLDFFDGYTFDEEDRAGRYAFRGSTPFTPGGSRYLDRGIGYDNIIEGRNLVGASASRLLPTETRLEFGGYHADYWYDGMYGSQLPGSRDTIYAALVSERETLRFKPFLRYRASKYDIREGWAEEVRGGIQGPITENLTLFGDIGYYWRTDSDYRTQLARVRLRHILNPLTYHQLGYYRGVIEPFGEIEDSVTYLLNHVFRENLSGQLYGSLAKFENAQSGGRTGEERRAALRFNYDLAQNIFLRLSGAYANFRYDDSTTRNFDEWIGRGEVSYYHTTSLQTRLTYQYRNRQYGTLGQSYWENLVTLTVLKYF